MSDPATLERTHEWIVVANRRWCLTCAAFQHRRDERHDWQPPRPTLCAWDTDYALRKMEAGG